MAQDSISDLIMKFVMPGGKAIPGETTTKLTLSDDDMAYDFEEGSMFEVESFTLAAGIGGQDDESKEATKNLRKLHDANRQVIIAQNKKIMKEFQRSGKQGQPDLLDVPEFPSMSEPDFSKFRKGDEDVKYPIDMEPVEFSRGIDKASSILLQNCINRVNYESATLIKRKPTGGPASGEVFFRLDFTTVLMTNIDWSDDVPIKETCKFICRAVTIHYKPQLPDGSLGGAVPGFWTMAPGLTQVQV